MRAMLKEAAMCRATSNLRQGLVFWSAKSGVAEIENYKKSIICCG